MFGPWKCQEKKMLRKVIIFIFEIFDCIMKKYERKLNIIKILYIFKLFILYIKIKISKIFIFKNIKNNILILNLFFIFLF